MIFDLYIQGILEPTENLILHFLMGKNFECLLRWQISIQNAAKLIKIHNG